MLAVRPTLRHSALSAVLAAVAVLSACSRDAADGPSGPGGPGGGAPEEVTVLTVAPRDVSLTSELPGRVSALLVAEVRPQVGGIVQTRAFKEGSDVKAGQTLYQIDPATYRAALQSADAALARAEANVVAARAKGERYKELVGIDAVSKQSADEAVAAAAQAVADVASAKAARETARINLAYTRVTAPISGRIGRSTVTPGALLTANQDTALATVQQLDTIYVDVTQSSAELLRLRKELAAGRLTSDKEQQAVVHLKLEDGSSYPLVGNLQFSEVTVDEQTSAVTLRATFPNPQKVLLPGMYVRAVLEEGTRRNAITVPQRAVTRDNQGLAIAMVVGEDGKVQQRSLNAPRTVGDQWLVDAGLEAGDRVVVEGLQKARPGAQVKAVPWSAAASAPGGAASGASAPQGGGAPTAAPNASATSSAARS